MPVIVKCSHADSSRHCKNTCEHNRPMPLRRWVSKRLSAPMTYKVRCPEYRHVGVVTVKGESPGDIEPIVEEKIKVTCDKSSPAEFACSICRLNTTLGMPAWNSMVKTEGRDDAFVVVCSRRKGVGRVTVTRADSERGICQTIW